MKNFLAIALLLLILFIPGSWLFDWCDECTPDVTTVIERDTVIIHDTIHAEIPAPQVVEVVRHDTVYLPAASSFGGGGVVLPIERVKYRTADYCAIIEGYHPRLVEMEIYRQTQIVNNNTTTTITRNPRWAITAGIGAGWTPKGLQPHIGVMLGYVVWSK